jgi:hypothetical protein
MPPPPYVKLLDKISMKTPNPKGGRVWWVTSEKVRGALVQKMRRGVENTNMTDYLQSINTIKHQ